MRYALAAFLRNLWAGLKLALFAPVSRLQFCVDGVQLLLLFALLCALDIGGDWLRFGGTSFNWLGAGSELAGVALLGATALLVALLLRNGGIALGLMVTAMSALPLEQLVANGAPLLTSHVALGRQAAVTGAALLVAWQLAILVRVVALQLDMPARRRWPRAAVGGLVLALPLALAPLLVPDVAWFRAPNPLGGNDALSAASEPVLAAQKELLDDALDSLDDRTPGGPNLYFVVYAPDGGDAAWNEHAETVRTLVDERLDTRGRSIVLRTHADTMLTTPFASVSNLRETLGEIASAGDPEQDVVMIYIGGKGARDGVIAATLPPLDLLPLTPAGLRSLLDDAGFEWRIVIVAACYAGAYADALEDSHTAVVAASAAGNPSFGCEGRGEPTFFGDALFVDGFAHTDGLAAAFAVARERVVAEEHEHGLSPSVPMMRVGDDIAPMLRHLRRLGGGATAAASGWRTAVLRPSRGRVAGAPGAARSAALTLWR